MSEKVLFEIDLNEKQVRTLGIPMDVVPEDLKIMVNGVDILEQLKVKEFKIVKVLK